MKALLALIIVIGIAGCVGQAQSSYIAFEGTDRATNITWLGHSSFRIDGGANTIYFDPFVLDENPKKANFILMTHDHFDHCARDNVEKLQHNETRIISTFSCIEGIPGKINSIIPSEHSIYTANAIRVDAFDAYNINKTYHEKGDGVGFLLTIGYVSGNVTIYHAGDTDNIPEFEDLADRVDVLLIPIGGKFTMDAEDAADAVKIIKPKVVIPMHYNSDRYGVEGIQADPERLEELLEGTETEVVILSPAVQ